MHWKGYAAVLAAAVLWGVSGVVAKSLFSGAVDPVALVEIRLTGVFALTLAVFLVKGWRIRLPLAAAVRLIPLGAAIAFTQSTYYLTINLANVTTAIFLQYTAPALVMAYGAVVLRERLTAAQLTALAGALFGGYLLVVGPQGLAVTPKAAAAGIASAAGFAAWVLLGRSRAQDLTPWEVLLYAFGAGAVLWSIYVPPWRAYLQPYTSQEWALIAFIVVFATLLPFGLFLSGLRFVDSRTASLTATLEPVVAALAAALLLGEHLTRRGVLGAALILASIALLQVLPLRPQPSATGRPST